MYDNKLIDLSIEAYCSHYLAVKPQDCFSFRNSFISNGANFFHSLLLSDYQDAEKVFNYCRDIITNNYSPKEKRNKFLNEILKFKQ